MKQFFTNIPLAVILLLIIQFIAIVVFVWLLQRFAIVLVKNRRKKEQIYFYIPLLRNIIWIAYIIYVEYILVSYQPIFVLTATIILLLLSWNMVKNFVQGTIYRLVKGNIIGTPIQIEGHKGKIIKMNDLKVSIQSSAGEEAQIPYTDIVDKVLVKTPQQKNTGTHTIVASVSKNDENENGMKEKIQAKMISYPWVIASKPIQIRFFKTEDADKVKITYALEDVSKAKDIEEGIQKMCQEI